MMICKNAIHHISCEDIESLDRQTRKELKQHMKKCAPCREYAGQIRAIRRAFKRKAKGLDVSEAELNRLRSAIMECLPEEE